MEQSGLGLPERQQEPTQGERWLQVIGYGHRVDEIITLGDGRQIAASEFDKECEEHAGPIFLAIEQMDPEDPNIDAYKAAARKAADMYLGPDPSDTTGV